MLWQKKYAIIYRHNIYTFPAFFGFGAMPLHHPLSLPVEAEALLIILRANILLSLRIIAATTSIWFIAL
jgi:hypothetical protein